MQHTTTQILISLEESPSQTSFVVMVLVLFEISESPVDGVAGVAGDGGSWAAYISVTRYDKIGSIEA